MGSNSSPMSPWTADPPRRRRKLFPFCTVGLAPQDLKYKGEDTETRDRPAHADPRACLDPSRHRHRHRHHRIGADCLLMATVHVAHDCELGDGVIISNNVVAGRACRGRRARHHRRDGGAAAIRARRHRRHGRRPYRRHARRHPLLPRLRPARGDAGAQHDRPAPARPGARRSCKPCQDAYRFIFTGPGVFARPRRRGRRAIGDDPYVAEMLDFIATPSRHGLIDQCRGCQRVSLPAKGLGCGAANAWPRIEDLAPFFHRRSCG